MPEGVWVQCSDPVTVTDMKLSECGFENLSLESTIAAHAVLSEADLQDLTC